jgi:hypothetical protein
LKLEGVVARCESRASRRMSRRPVSEDAKGVMATAELSSDVSIIGKRIHEGRSYLLLSSRLSGCRERVVAAKCLLTPGRLAAELEEEGLPDRSGMKRDVAQATPR